MNAPIKVLIADDHPLFIQGVSVLLQEEKQFEIIDSAMDGNSLISQVHNNPPDVILMDVNMPGLNGLESTRIIKKEYPDVKVIMLSTYSEGYILQKAKEHGASGYLLKTCPKELLIDTIIKVSNGEEFFYEEEQKPERNTLDIKDPIVLQYNLTKREIEVINLIKKGLKTEEIAEQLFLSPLTVQTHRKNICAKLGVSNVAALLRIVEKFN